MTNSRPPGTFSIRSLLLAMGSTGLAFGLLSACGPLVMPVSLAILLYWFGAGCMVVSERRFTGSRAVLLIGCMALSSAVVVGLFGTVFVGGLLMSAAWSD